MKIIEVEVTTDQYEKNHGDDDNGRPIIFTISAEVFTMKLSHNAWPYLQTLNVGWWGCWLTLREGNNPLRSALEDQFGKLSQVAFSYVSESGTIARGAFRLDESLPDDDDEYLKELPF